MRNQSSDFDQSGFDLRVGWGSEGLEALGPDAAATVIVDVLSFSTAVDIAVGRGAVVLPYRWHDGTEADYARRHNAITGSKSPAPGTLSLRPASLREIPPATRLVLPSPNGSTLSFAAQEVAVGPVLIGCLRNATATARAVQAAAGKGVALIAAGERWQGTTGPLRPAIEDLLGVGAIAAALANSVPSLSPSPEAMVAMAAFADAAPNLPDRLRQCGSGRELIRCGYGTDVVLAAELDASDIAPTMVGPEIGRLGVGRLVG